MLVTEDCDVGCSVPERLEGRHLDVIAFRRVEGFRSAVTDDRAGVGEEPVRMADPFDRIDDLFRPVVIVIRKPVDLIAVKDRVRLQKRDIAFDLTAAGIRFGLGEPAGIDDGCAGFALANLRADLTGLPVGHPERCFKAAGQAFRPEQQNVDARVWLAGMSERTGDPAFEPSRAPGFDPRGGRLLKIGDDFSVIRS